MSMHGQLLAKKHADERLDAFVVAIDKIIGPMKWEQRHSSNYVEERYFSGSALALRVDVAIGDDQEFSDYDFLISISPSIVGAAEKSFLDGIADNVARALALHGYELVRPNEMSTHGNGGFVYHLNPNPESKPREKVIVASI